MGHNFPFIPILTSRSAASAAADADHTSAGSFSVRAYALQTPFSTVQTDSWFNGTARMKTTAFNYSKDQAVHIVNIYQTEIKITSACRVDYKRTKIYFATGFVLTRNIQAYTNKLK